MVSIGTEPIGKRQLGRPSMRWEDVVMKDEEVLGSGLNWKILAMDYWRIPCEIRWSSKLNNPPSPLKKLKTKFYGKLNIQTWKKTMVKI